jgi:SpoIID/LytB domain protein
MWMKTFPPAYCNAPEISPGSEFRWLRIIPAKDLEQYLGKRHRVGHIRRIIPVGHSPGGNVREVWIEGSQRTEKIKRENLIRYVLGSLRSTLFMVETHENSKGEPESFWFYGGGWGHAVGLCQTGAGGQATAGKTAAEIIPFYYPGTTLQTLPY